VPLSLVYDYDMLDYQTHDPFHAFDGLIEKDLPEIFWTRHNGGHWLITGIEAITGASLDPGLFSSRRISRPEQLDTYVPYFPPVDADPPLHTAFRSALAPLFSPSRVEAMKDRIRLLTRSLIAEITARGQCEFMSDFGAQMPVIVFLELLGLPQNDRLKLRSIVHRVMDCVNFEESAIPLQELADYVRPFIKERSANPGGDALSHIAKQSICGRPIELEEVVKLARTLLVAGLDTVSGMLGFFVHYLAEMPAARHQLIEQPGMIVKAVEEMLRRHPVTNLGRYLTRDVVYRGVQMKLGDMVMSPLAMFNFDRRRFSDPLSVQFDRPNNRHAAFGLGAHICIGAALARAELRIFVEEWLRQVPDFYVMLGTEIEYRHAFNLIYKSLPIIIGARPS
jgi:cytochrome P450